MLTLVFGMPVSKGKVNRSLDLCLITKETTGDCEQGFVFLMVNGLIGPCIFKIVNIKQTCLYMVLDPFP